MLIHFASLTEPLVKLATNLIGDLGIAGVFLLTMSSAVIGLPGTEPTMLFAGFDVFHGHLSLVAIIISGVIGDVVGGSIAYAIGYWGRQELLERQGSKLHMNPARLQRAHAWFERYGPFAIFISRLVPVVRAAFPYAAGVAEMPYSRFLPLATLGSVIWIGGLAVLGDAVGSQWQTWRHHLEYVDYVGALVVVGAIVYLIVRRRSDRGGPGEPAVGA